MNPIKRRHLKRWRDAAMQGGASKRDAKRIAEKVMDRWADETIAVHPAGKGPWSEAYEAGCRQAGVARG